MADNLYTRGLDEWAALTTNTYKVLLLKGSGYTFAKAHDFVADLTPASNEVTSAGYSRQTLGSKTRTLDDTLDRITYDAADPNFGTITTGQTVSVMVLFRFVTNDADSILMGYYDLTDVDTAAVVPFVVTLGTAGLTYLDAV